uniref:Uncharacterized protein n=1 Tax=Meloidogyne javanica TaxID=6303 RepID=A0A915LBJ4_MELJA
MIQAGIPQAQMMQLLQTMQATATNNNNISSPAINGTTNSATNSSSGGGHQTVNQAHQHFSLANQHQQAASQSAVVASGGGGNGGSTAAVNTAGAHQVAVAAAASLQVKKIFFIFFKNASHNPTASVAAVQQAHVAAVAASGGAAGQHQSAIHATSLMQQMAAVAAAAQQQHPHSQQPTNTSVGLQAVMQQQLQQTAAAGVSVSIPPGMTVAVQHPQLASNVGQNVSANNAGQLVPSLATPSLAWPIFQPIVNIPFFDMATYQKVNLDVQPSAMANGMDLPLNDINTLRKLIITSSISGNRVVCGQTIQYNPNPQINEQIGQNISWQVNTSSNGANTPQGLILLQQNGGGGELPQQIIGIGQIIGGNGGIINTGDNDNTGQISYGRTDSTLGGIGVNCGKINEIEGGGGSGGVNIIMSENPSGKFNNIQNRGNIPSKFYGNKKSVNVIGQQLLQESEKSANPSNNNNAGGVTNNAAAAAAQLLHGGIVGFQNQLQMNQLAALMANQQSQQNAKLASLSNTGVDSSTDLGSGNVGAAGNGHGGSSKNGTPCPINGRNSVNGSQQQTTLSGNNSVSPKTGSASVPTDPAPRKQSSMILSNPLNAELGELKQRGLNALRSPEAMSDSLQKRLVEMAATLNSTMVAPMVSNGGGGGNGNGGNGGNLISTGGGACNGNNIPPAILLQQQQQIYQHQHQLLQQQLLQQQILAQQNQQNGPISSQNQQTSLANNFSNVISNQRSQSNSGQQQQSGGTNTNLLQSMIPSAETEGAPNLLAATEMHYTETFRQEGGNRKIKPATPQSGRQPPELEVGAGLNQRRKSGVYMLGMNIKEEKPSTPQSTSPQSTQPTATSTTAISTSAMMNYMNSVLTSARSHLQGQGAGIQFDQNGNQIDYSCRPIDQIFRRAREDLISNTNVSNVASIPSTTSNGENTLTTSAIGGDLGVLSRTCLIGNKKRVSSGTGSEEGPSAKSARSSLGNSSGNESTQDRQAWTTPSADLVVDTKNVQCSSAGPEQLEREEMSNNDNPINIVDGNISSDSSKQKLNENIEEDDFNGNDENNLINVVVQDNEDINEGERAAAALEQGNNNTSILTNNIRAQDEGIDSPSNGKQLRIVEDEEDDQ